ncbi:hypothetical protein B5F33_10410 [Collinsella sp. An2]|nr:hypothetical protein B5F33_10410 [Collinsella sp. An2]
MEGGSMADPKHPRRFTDDFKRQIVSLCNAGKPPGEIMREYDLGSTTLGRWIDSVDAAGSPHAADDRTPEQNRIIESERENKRLRMEVDVLEQAALIFARKWRRWRLTPTAIRHQRSARSSACRARPTATSARARSPRPRRTPSSPTFSPSMRGARAGTARGRSRRRSSGAASSRAAGGYPAS